MRHDELGEVDFLGDTVSHAAVGVPIVPQKIEGVSICREVDIFGVPRIKGIAFPHSDDQRPLPNLVTQVSRSGDAKCLIRQDALDFKVDRYSP